MKTTRLLASLLAALACAAPVARAVTVTNTNDSGAGSLREAVSDGSLIDFAPELNGATITLAAEIATAGGTYLEIDATSLPKGITLKANGTNRILFAATGNLKLRGITFTRGGGNGAQASGSGGAVRANDPLSRVDVEHCTFDGNTAAQAGGAIFAAGGFGASSCTFYDNRVTGTAGKGGALSLSEDSDLVNCTFTANKAANGGSIFCAARNTTYTFTHCTIFRNGDGSVGAGGIETLAQATVKLTNTIVAGNGGKRDFQELLLGANATLEMDGMNVLQKQGAAFLIVPGVAAHVTLTDPKLKDLGDYGGRTKTMPLKKDSPAIFAATKLDVVELDQRGVSRKGGVAVRPTVGAVQFIFNDPNYDTIYVTTLADELDAPGTVGTGVSLREALRDVKSGATIRFAPGVFNVEPPAVIGLDAAKGTLQIAKDVTIDASDCRRGVVIDGGNAVRVMEIVASTVDVETALTVKLERLRLTRGRRPAAAVVACAISAG